jgi:hypothetical protein
MTDLVLTVVSRLASLAPQPPIAREFGPPGWWKPTLLLFGLVALAYLLMWWGWRGRGQRHELPPLPEPSGEALAEESQGRYLGTTVAGSWLDRVVAQGLGARSDCSIARSKDGLVVRRPGRPAFLIRHQALVSARKERGIAGKVIPPDGVLVLTWRHGDLTLDSGFRLTPADHDRWIVLVGDLVKEHTA